MAGDGYYACSSVVPRLHACIVNISYQRQVCLSTVPLFFHHAPWLCNITGMAAHDPSSIFTPVKRKVYDPVEAERIVKNWA